VSGSKRGGRVVSVWVGDRLGLQLRHHGLEARVVWSAKAESEEAVVELDFLRYVCGSPRSEDQHRRAWSAVRSILASYVPRGRACAASKTRPPRGYRRYWSDAYVFEQARRRY